MNLYSAATLGLIETPFFGKGNYYILNVGANYLLAPNLNAGISGMYNSNFGVVPFWNVSADLQYLAGRNLMLEGSVGYMQTGANMFHLNQSAILVDLHARYRLSDDWPNAYGGFCFAKHQSACRTYDADDEQHILRRNFEYCFNLRLALKQA